MKSTFEITNYSRSVIAKFLDNYSLEQLNKVPEGFNNNLIWNIAHIIVVQQMLVYNLFGLPMMVDGEMVAKYKRGTKPESDVTQEEVDFIKSLLFTAIEKTETDFNAGGFENFTEFTTMTGYTMKSVNDAITFNIYHEAVHTGMMMSIRKFI
ncbi:DinB family protein [Flavobacterium sp. 3HN19-14]|uniref:DinB family protein n=1 Tax=Flavobacterium sp. 3HN19-14 TaxID=3448133 RepID=UPI003EE0AFA3